MRGGEAKKADVSKKFKISMRSYIILDDPETVRSTKRYSSRNQDYKYHYVQTSVFHILDGACGTASRKWA